MHLSSGPPCFPLYNRQSQSQPIEHCYDEARQQNSRRLLIGRRDRTGIWQFVIAIKVGWCNDAIIWTSSAWLCRSEWFKLLMQWTGGEGREYVEQRQARWGRKHSHNESENCLFSAPHSVLVIGCRWGSLVMKKYQRDERRKERTGFWGIVHTPCQPTHVF